MLINSSATLGLVDWSRKTENRSAVTLLAEDRQCMAEVISAEFGG